jgi:hypothetical protein
MSDVCDCIRRGEPRQDCETHGEIAVLRSRAEAAEAECARLRAEGERGWMIQADGRPLINHSPIVFAHRADAEEVYEENAKPSWWRVVPVRVAREEPEEVRICAQPECHRPLAKGGAGRFCPICSGFAQAWACPKCGRAYPDKHPSCPECFWSESAPRVVREEP